MDDRQLICYLRSGTCSLRGSVLLHYINFFPFKIIILSKSRSYDQNLSCCFPLRKYTYFVRVISSVSVFEIPWPCTLQAHTPLPYPGGAMGVYTPLQHHQHHHRKKSTSDRPLGNQNGLNLPGAPLTYFNDGGVRVIFLGLSFGPK